MKSSEAPDEPVIRQQTLAARPDGRFPGQLSRTENLLYTAARWIDLVVDRLRDHPMLALAIAAGALVLIALIPRG